MSPSNATEIADLWQRFLALLPAGPNSGNGGTTHEAEERIARRVAELVAERLGATKEIEVISRKDLAKLWSISDDTLERLEMRLDDKGKPLLRRLPHMRHAMYTFREVQRFTQSYPKDL